MLPLGLAVSFVPQHGPYADLTSVLNGADHLCGPRDFYVAFADNLYRGPNPLLALSAATLTRSPCWPAGTGPSWPPAMASSPPPATRDSSSGRPGRKTQPGAGPALEQRYGRRNLFLLEGRARLTATFTSFARSRLAPSGGEPKLSLALAAWARTHPVHIVETTVDVIDLGALATLGGPGRGMPRHDIASA